MKIVTKKKQEEIDRMFIKKLRFVAKATLSDLARSGYLNHTPQGIIKHVEDKAEQVFYADSVI